MKSKGWEERFRENFVSDSDEEGSFLCDGIDTEDMMNFIASELQKQKEELIRIVRKLQVTPQKDYLVEGYAKAPDDIIKKIEEGNEIR